LEGDRKSLQRLIPPDFLSRAVKSLLSSLCPGRNAGFTRRANNNAIHATRIAGQFFQHPRDAVAMRRLGDPVGHGFRAGNVALGSETFPV
jgi:hypothetical protein